jgi:hypothetical protein
MLSDWAVVLFLLVAVATGLRTMHLHDEYFGEFKLRDIVFCRLDALLYTFNSASTALCVIDIAIRVYWASTVGWTDLGTQWACISFAFHSTYAIGSAIVHLAIDRLLSNANNCALCKRPWNRG